MQIDIPKDLEKVLAKISKKLGMEPSSVVLGALQDYLEDQEDYLDGVNAYNEYIQNGRKSTSLADVKKELGL